MRVAIGLTALAALAACGGNKAADNGAGANAAAPANLAVPANAVAPSNLTANASAAARPVMVGIDAELDKCPSTARSSAGRPVVVRAAPNANAPQVARIERETLISICDTGDNPQAEWFGIVYSETSEDRRDCGLGGASAGNGGTPYAGPCRSGWVRASEIEVVAG